MKKMLLTCCALGALTVGAQAADVSYRGAQPVMVAPSANWSATGEAYLGGTWAGDLDADEDPRFLGVNGAVVFNQGGWGFQLDIFGEGGDIDGGDYGYATTGFGGHLFMRNDAYAIGILGNIASYSDAYNEYHYFRYAFGLEGAMYLGQFTVAAQAAYLGKLTDTCDCASTGWYGKLEGRYFITPNAMLALRGELYNGEIYEDGDTYTRGTIGLRGEYRFNSPFGLFADVAWSTNKHTGSDSFSDTTAKVGLTVNLNTRTLIEKDRKGASFTQPFVGVGELMGLWQF